MKSFKNYLIESSNISKEKAKELGNSLGVDWSNVDMNEFLMGLDVESEHNDGSKLDVVDSDLDLAKIVLAHLKEKPDYYTKLKTVEEDAPTNSVGNNAVAGLSEPIIRIKPKVLRRKID